jgi:tetratricopeptide (TPR) repeat protein
MMMLMQPAANLDDAIRLYEKGDYRQAATVFAQLREGSPDDARIHTWLGKSYLKTRNWDAAVHEMEKAVQLKPSAQNNLWLGRAYGAKAAHSIFFTAAGLARRVLKAFETAKNISPDDLDVRFDLLEYYLEAPGMLGGGKEKASAEAQAIARQNPLKGYLARSTILRKDKKWDLTRKELVQATVDFPNDAAAFKDLAAFLLDQQDFAGALQYARKAVSLDAASKGSQLLVAAASIRLRSDLAASGNALNALASGFLTDADPAFEEVYYWLGECYLAQGDKVKARDAFKSSLAFNPEYDRAKARL